jgi:predicted ribosome quality control (RQC) complex YloA/Tae2 family protein
MDIKIDFDKSAGKNADTKYKLKDKYDSKIKGLKKAIQSTKQKLEALKNHNLNKEEKKYTKIKNIKKEWYEKYRWFFTSNNKLVICGKDAKNNEEVVKKHLLDNDLYFHADLQGAPHTILKEGLHSDIEDKNQAAKFALCFSSAWKSKIYSADVYSVKADQVTKTAKSGESLATGAFVIKGKREYFHKVSLELSIGYSKKLNKVIIGPKKAITKQSDFIFNIVPGDLKKSDFAKKLQEKFKLKNIDVSLDLLISLLPSGETSFKE